MPTISIDWNQSPRVISVDQPDVAISVQELVDLCRTAEDQTDNIGYERLINAAGKEDLGGGTLVGITAELQNAQVTFDDRSTSTSSGVISTPDTGGTSLISTTSTFQADLIVRGDLLVNNTDGSHATVLEVVSETELVTTPLGGGTDNQYDTSDVITLWPIYQCTISGGNTVAIDDVGAALNPVLQSFGTQIVIAASSSATLQEQTDIQHASFDGGVHVDVTSSQTGTAYPSGNSANPVNNWADAVVIDIREGFNQYFVERSTTLDVTQDYTDASFVGKSIIDTVLTVPAGTLIDKSEFFNVSLEGSLGQTTIMQNCFLGETNELENVRGVIEQCSIGPAKLTLGGASTTIVRFVNCRGAGLQFSPPTINCGGNGPEVDIQDYVGQLNIENKTGTSVFEVSISGKLTLDSSVINGTVIVNGQGTLEDNSGSGCVVVDNMIKGEQLSELWRLQGLDIINPMTVTPTLRSVSDGSILLGLTGDGVTTTTVTRQVDATLVLELPLVADLLDDVSGVITPTFTRASTGTYIDSITGLVTSAAIDAPRYEVGGLLIEESRTNKIIRSMEFDHAQFSYTNATINANAGTAPDGTTTADDMVDDGTTGIHRAVYGSSVLTLGNTWTVSVFAKYIDHQWIAINETTNTTYFDIQNGVVGTNANDAAGMDAMGDGWYRCWFRRAITGSSKQVHLFMAEADADVSYAGTGEKVRLWGLQAEIGAFPTSFIPTTTAAQTRSADFLSYNDDTLVSDTAGTIYAEVTPLFASDLANDAVILNIADQQAGPLYVVDDTTQKIAINDSTNTSSYDPTLTRLNLAKTASRWGSSEIQTVVGGVASTASAYDGAFTRTAGTLYIGSDSTGNHFNGNIRSVRVYNADLGQTALLVETA